MLPRIAILGAGSVGCFVGGAWAHAGLDVTLIGRPALRKTIATSGLQLTSHDGLDIGFKPGDIAVETDPARLADADLIALAVKSTATAQAASEIAGFARPDAAILSLQNGISNVEILQKTLPDRTVLRGMVGFNVAWLGDGHLHRGTSGMLAAEHRPVLEPLATVLRATSGELTLVDDALSLAWGKLLLNLNNAINALSGQTLLAELSQRPFRQVLAMSMREALAVLKSAGISPAKVGPLPPRLLPAFVAAPDFVFNTIGLKLQKIDASARSSMADDFASNRPTEIDYLNGEIVRLAATWGAQAPVNQTIVQLVKDAEASGKRNWTGPELLDRIRPASK